MCDLRLIVLEWRIVEGRLRLAGLLFAFAHCKCMLRRSQPVHERRNPCAFGWKPRARIAGICSNNAPLPVSCASQKMSARAVKPYGKKTADAFHRIDGRSNRKQQSHCRHGPNRYRVCSLWSPRQFFVKSLLSIFWEGILAMGSSRSNLERAPCISYKSALCMLPMYQ